MLFFRSSLFAISVLLGSLFFSKEGKTQFTAEFLPPAHHKAPLYINLPEDLDILILSSLAVSLDGTDITAMLGLEDHRFIYHPVMPLSAGPHKIRLFHLSSATRFEEIDAWEFEVTAPKSHSTDISESEADIADQWLRSAEITVNSLTEFSNRFSDKNLISPPKETILSGSGDVLVHLSAGNWQMAASGNYILQNESALSPTGNDIDMGQYSLSAKYQGQDFSGKAILGDHQIVSDPLLFSGFYRRGGSVSMATADQRLKVKSFAALTTSHQGIKNFTGLENDQNRLYGLQAEIKPFSKDPTDLTLITSWYQGKDRPDPNTEAVSAAHAYGITAKKSFWQDRLKLSGSYAHSIYDADQKGDTAPEDRASAISATIETDLIQQANLLNQPFEMSFDQRFERIDPFFYSLGNRNLPRDRQLSQSALSLTWGNLSAAYQFDYETNNIDNFRSLPTDRFQQSSFSLSYNFDAFRKAWQWLGNPYLSLSGFNTFQDRLKTPENYTGPAHKSHSASLTAVLGSQYSEWDWQMGHTFSFFADKTRSYHDSQSYNLSVSAGWFPTPDYALSLAYDLSIIDDQQTPHHLYDHGLQFGLTATVIPDRLALNFDYNLNLPHGNGNIPDTHLVNGEVEYTLLRQHQNRPGIAFALQGSLEHLNGYENPLLDQTAYQLFSVLRVKMPLAY